MNFTCSQIFLYTVCSFFLVSCNPPKNNVSPAETRAVQINEKNKQHNKENLTPNEQLKLKNEEENLEPFPG